ncbi:hypothetical protein ABPG75_002268 [Micractinium tetrahymenae]
MQLRTASQTSHLELCSTSYRPSSRPSGGRLRVQPVRCSENGQDAGLAVQPRPLVVKSLPVARAAAPAPQPVPVEHSSAYLLRNRRQLSPAEEEQQRQERGGEPFTGSAVEWVLRKADESLDEIEENPPEYAKVIYDISTGPIGKAASASVTTAAKVTVQVGAEALKVAAPVGKWALQQGVKLAVGAVAKGISSAVNSGDSKKDGGSSKGKKK